jgi:SAM-dependent methyltransferase
MAGIPDSWTAGSTYEGFMGRWSRQLAPLFLSWLHVPAGVHWLDVGCGTGAMTEAIFRHADPGSVVGCDPAQAFVEYAQSHAPSTRASFTVAGAGNLPPRAGGYGCVTSLVALNFIPDPTAGVREMRALTAPGGLVSACVWDYAGGMELLRRFWTEAAELDPAARDLDEGRRFPLCHPDALMALFRSAGLHAVRCEPVDMATTFASFADFWQPFLGGVGPAPSYVASLAPDRRELLEARLRRALPPGAGGEIALGARAWAVRGMTA